jgi:protein involved in polysaccharide export with SLBB domain
MKTTTRIFLALLTFVGASTLRAQDSTAFGTGGLNPGDQIRIVVFRQPELSGDFFVAGNGTVIHPLYREVQVTGVPLSVVEDRLRVFLSKYETNPQFVIQPLVKIVVGGEVKSPNIYMVPPETTIAQAVALAGGQTDKGLLDDVRIIRDRQVVKVDVSKPESDAQLLKIRSNDQILVGRRNKTFLDYVTPITSTLAAAAAITSVIRR